MTSNLTTLRRRDLRVPGSSFNHRNCETCNAFAATDCAKSLRTIAFHSDWRANRAREPLTHFVTARRQLGALTNHCSVDISWFEPRFANESSDFGEKTNAVGTGPLRVGIGKVLTDIAKSRSSEQRVCTCVGHHISIAVAN